MRILGQVQNSDVVKNIDKILEKHSGDNIEEILNRLKYYLDGVDKKQGILSSNHFAKCIGDSSSPEESLNKVLNAITLSYIDILTHFKISNLTNYERAYSLLNDYLKPSDENNHKNHLDYDLSRIKEASKRADAYLKNIRDVETSEIGNTINKRINKNSCGIIFSWVMMLLGVFFILFSPKIAISIFELENFSLKDNYLNLIPIVSPSIFIILYFMRLSLILIRQRTDMVFKYDSIRLYMNYKTISNDDITEQREIKNKLLSNLISALSENPTRLDMKNDYSPELKEISDLLKNIQSASKGTPS